MIRSFIILAALICFFTPAFCQVLPLDSLGKVTYYEVVVASPVRKEALYDNAMSWLNDLKDVENKVVIESTDVLAGKVVAKNEFPLFSQTGVLKKLNGKISYDMIIEVKDTLYRYTFSNFLYHYYKQDRTYKIVPTGKTKKLEDPNASGWQKLWNKHRAQTAAKLNTDITKLKIQMVYVPTAPGKEAEKKKEVKWN